MINKTEHEEKQYLEDVKRALREVFADIDSRARRYAKDVREQKKYLWDHKADMDHAEKIFVRQGVSQAVMTGEAAEAQKRRLEKLCLSPYFGRFDFRELGQINEQAIYLGIHSFFDPAAKKNLIYDWRAPIAAMFYDHETGAASYTAPSRELSGEILLKRQYRIRNGQMEFMLESALNIMDDVLQRELSRTSDDRMKNIVATIQRDQNAIIRNESAHVLVIQGVAGSGKTSIALHRVAFLLYRFKETLGAKDVLIISPNRVFADYISNVLPELGEEKVPETGMEKIAHEVLSYAYKFQTFFEQTALLVEKDDAAFQARIEAKATGDFVDTLEAYIAHVEKTCFQAEDLHINGRLVPEWFLRERFQSYRGMPVRGRLDRLAIDVEHSISLEYNYDISAAERASLKKALKKMCPTLSVRSLYKDVYAWMGKPELFRLAKNSTYEYADVFPLIYLKLRLEGIKKKYTEVKHLLIDEMQDYAAVQYAVIALLFPCKKTILGDAGQSVNPFSSSRAEAIARAFSGAECVYLRTSYRSTCEITRFAARIVPDADLIPIERHGKEPEARGFDTPAAEITGIKQIVDEFKSSDHMTLGIICKTQTQAEKLFTRLKQYDHGIHLLSAHSSSFHEGITVCSAQMSKGLEFDQVIIARANAENYKTLTDKHLLYIACTRAMHLLTLTFSHKSTRFISCAAESAEKKK